MVLRWQLASTLAVVTALAVAGSDRLEYADLAAAAGLEQPIIYGGTDNQKYILESTGTGVAAFDYDGDGLQDLFFVNGTRFDGVSGRNLLYHNSGNGRFEEVGRRAGVAATGWGQAVCIGDFDNDDRTDVFVTYYGFNKLFHNDGDGTFTDVAAQARVAGDRPRWGSGCTFFDYDRDGRLDLFVANYVAYEDAASKGKPDSPPCLFKGVEVMCGPTGLRADENILYHNNRDRTFTEVTHAAGIAPVSGHYALQPVAADLDEDGWPDLYVGCDATQNILYRNKGDGTFTDEGLTAGAAVNSNGTAQATMGVDIADYDGDGRADIFVTNFSDDTPTLYRNLGAWQFDDLTLKARLGRYRQYVGWATLFVDVDLDGWKDIFIVNGHIYPQVDRYSLGLEYRQSRQLYRNLANGTFEDVTAAAGPSIRRKAAGRGAAAEDFDGDGQLEIVVTNLNEPPSYLHNQRPRPGNWLIVEPHGVASNRSAIGARVEIQAGGRVQKGEVRSSRGYYSSSGLRVHFGLGAAEKLDELRIFWPSGRKSVMRGVAVNRVLRVREPES